MAEIVGIRFKKACKIYYFDPAGIDLEVNDYVIVKTARGLELGLVVIAPKQVEDTEVTEPLKSVVRKAEPEDISRAQEFAEKEKDALSLAYRAVSDGARGVAFGRNVFQAKNPEVFFQVLKEIVKGKVEPSKATRKFGMK